MNAKRQTHLIELQRRIKIAIAALEAVKQSLEIEAADAAISPDGLAERIRDATKTIVSRPKDH